MGLFRPLFVYFRLGKGVDRSTYFLLRRKKGQSFGHSMTVVYLQLFSHDDQKIARAYACRVVFLHSRAYIRLSTEQKLPSNSGQYFRLNTSAFIGHRKAFSFCDSLTASNNVDFLRSEREQQKAGDREKITHLQQKISDCKCGQS